jgi:ADP-ribose pyrophosphatase YjhB (NUDIX family)
MTDRLLYSIWRLLPYRLQWILCWLLNAPFLVGVVGVVVNDQSQVLVLNHSYRRGPSWGLPSGWLKPGEWPEAALAREIKEETGLLIYVGPLLNVNSALTRNRLDIVYLCRLRGGVPCVSPEVSEMRFCEPEAMPEAMYPAQKAMVHLAQARHRHWFEKGQGRESPEERQR